MRKSKNIFSIFKNFNTVIQLLIFIILFYTVGEILDGVFETIYGKEIFKLDFKEASIYYILFEVVILAPLIETFFIQFLMIEFLLLIFQKTNNNQLLAILSSGILFGILHQYNLAYMISTTILGWGFGFVFIFYKNKEKINPLLAVIITHSTYNFIILIKDYY